MLSLLEVSPCPQQRNGIDCGLFTIGVVLHLLGKLHVTPKTFKDQHVSHLRKVLGTFLASAMTGHKQKKVTIPSALIRDCFPSLKGTTIVGECGVELLGSKTTGTTTVSVVASPPPPPVKEVLNSNMKEGGQANFDSMDVSITASDSESPQDVTMEELLKGRKVQAFASLDDVIPMVETYEKITGNKLKISRSETNRFRLYKCCEHMNCTYEILFGRRRLDGSFAVKRINNRHTGGRRSARARDGRRWKERRVGKLDNVIVQVLNTKNDKPLPADLVKTAATLNGDVIPYFAAYRALNTESKAVTREEKLGFQLLIPYLEQMKVVNPGSFIGYVRNEDATMKEFYVIPGFMNDSLQFVRPVISLDAAHLKSKHKGTLFVATALSGANEIYPIGFMVSAGNEDMATLDVDANCIEGSLPNHLELASQYRIRISKVCVHFG